MMAIPLWIAGLVAMVAHMAQLAFSIWTVNVINGLFSFWQEYKPEKAAEAMRRMLPVSASVLRDGEARRVPAAELVPGDVILLSEGDSISADGRVVEEAELRVDQSTLTGESVQVRKTSEASPRKNLARIEIPNSHHHDHRGLPPHGRKHSPPDRHHPGRARPRHYRCRHRRHGR